MFDDKNAFFIKSLEQLSTNLQLGKKLIDRKAIDDNKNTFCEI